MQFIQLSNIHKSYGKPPHTFEALKGVNLQIEQREFIALMGPSGSGKSTMANILGTLDSPTSGIYEFCGVNVCALNLKEKALNIPTMCHPRLTLSLLVLLLLCLFVTFLVL